MKLDKFQELKVKLEILKLEKNFFALDRVLYYFSFLGNIFLVYFGYFFISHFPALSVECCYTHGNSFLKKGRFPHPFNY